MSWWYEVSLLCEYYDRPEKTVKTFIGRSRRLTLDEVREEVRTCMEENGPIVEDTYKVYDIVERHSEEESQ